MFVIHGDNHGQTMYAAKVRLCEHVKHIQTHTLNSKAFSATLFLRSRSNSYTHTLAGRRRDDGSLASIQSSLSWVECCMG